MNIRDQVKSIVKKYGTRNPFEILEQKNAILVYAPLEGVRGFYQYFQRNHIIYIDENLPKSEKTFVCAHELGHLFLHKKANALYMDSHTLFNTNKFENEANTFAAELLIPDELVYDHPGMTSKQIARLAGYSEKIMTFKTIEGGNTYGNEI
ncbi:ImmA/IrrE family metallo-endopeptidase [Roseburia sp. MUC/MUC-530-WT-4D]|uniref:ImmA/IrrE family metallo-endopeptidase n=1 Tax=Roseburia porci TaxID=2605790 RepID=A0A6L5YMW0_9FIRM|nr:ImmA/IrrE family metallo-endopeptidase [Roseburia porci]MST73432.1 ImmA/IrrE family metallo-endopeptidase [Roseburia porci]